MRISIIVCLALFTLRCLAVRAPSPSASTAQLIISVDNTLAADTFSFTTPAQTFPTPVFPATSIGGRFAMSAYTTAKGREDLRLVVFEKPDDGPIMSNVLPVIVGVTIHDAMANNSLRPSRDPSANVEPEHRTAFAFAYFNGVGSLPSDSTVVEYVSGHIVRRFAIANRAVVGNPRLALRRSDLKVAQSAAREIHLKLAGERRQQSLPILLYEINGQWHSDILSWTERRRLLWFPIEQVTSWQLYLIEPPKQWR